MPADNEAQSQSKSKRQAALAGKRRHSEEASHEVRAFGSVGTPHVHEREKETFSKTLQVK